VPGGATSALLCEYQSLNAPEGLIAHRTVSDSSTLERLTNEANSGSVPPAGTTQSCPADFGKSTDVYLTYANAGTLWLYVDMGGCDSIIDQYGWSEDGALVEDLQQLLGSTSN